LFIKNINDESKDRALVVVEGKRDYNALKSIGILGSIFMLCHNGGLMSLLSKIDKYKTIILLFDLDREGRILTKKTALLLQGRILFNLFYRRKLKSITKGKIKRIEDLKHYKNYL
jgi:5S rRNA maturation endonuclease (ribonuclease M5)